MSSDYSIEMDSSVVGGACFIDHWRYMVSTPLAVLKVDDDGATVDVRPKWFKTFVKSGMKLSLKPFRGEALWEAAWEDIVGVRLAGPTAVLENRRGERCRFISDSPGQLALLTDALQRHYVPVRSVQSTFLDVYLNRRWPA